MLIRASVVASLLALAPLLSGAEVHRCTVQGKLVFQDNPCAAPRESPARVVPQPSSQPVAQASKDELRKQAEALRERNAREREELQKSFRSTPSTASLAAGASAQAAGAALTQAQVCRAAVAAVMGRDPRIVTAVREAEGVTFLSYVRPNDGTVWSYKCRTQGRIVSWGNANGRWRDHPLDGTVSFERTNTSLVIRQRHSDSSVSTKSFAVEHL